LLCSFVLLGFSSATPAHGFNDGIEWHTLDEGLALAKTENKPIMLLIHKSWCGACKRLKPEFQNSPDIVPLSKNFVMVNTVDDAEPKDSMFSPDGGYIPRILFLTPQGEVQPEIFNKGRDNYKYFYPSIGEVITTMKSVMGAAATSTAAKQEL